MEQPVTFLVWTDNSPGVLLRITTLFTRRKINVESLTVSATEAHGISRFTIVINCNPVTAATIGRQIERMIEVRRVVVFEEGDVLHREVALVRAMTTHEQSESIRTRYPSCGVVQSGGRGALFQFTGTEAEISAFLAELAPHGVVEVVRSGRIAVTPEGDYDNDLSRSLHGLRPEANEGPDM